MRHIEVRIADRKLTCARCLAVYRDFKNLDELREVVARMSLPDSDEFDKDRLPEYQNWLTQQEAELASETRPETCNIKRGDRCVFVDLSGAHYLHLACTEKYIEDVRRALVLGG